MTMLYIEKINFPYLAPVHSSWAQTLRLVKLSPPAILFNEHSLSVLQSTRRHLRISTIRNTPCAWPYVFNHHRISRSLQPTLHLVHLQRRQRRGEVDLAPPLPTRLSARIPRFLPHTNMSHRVAIRPPPCLNGRAATALAHGRVDDENLPAIIPAVSPTILSRALAPLAPQASLAHALSARHARTAVARAAFIHHDVCMACARAGPRAAIGRRRLHYHWEVSRVRVGVRVALDVFYRAWRTLD